MVRKEEELKRRLSAFGLTPKDLSKEELAQARRDLRLNGTGGFFSSDELVRKSFRCASRKKK